MNRLYKFTVFLLVLIVLFNFNIAYGNANDGLYIWTKSSILIETETGKVLAEDDADKLMSPASLSKIMTFLIALESIKSGEVRLDDRVTISREAAKTGSSSYRLRTGEVVDLRELIESMMIVSSNASAVAIGEHISGETDDFVMLMNKRAREIGMTNTHFINPHGLPIYKSDTTSISNMSTARDLAILSRYLLLNFKNEVLNVTNRKIFVSRFKSYKNANTNPLLTSIKGVDGIKTGYTGKAGYCLAFTKRIGDNKENTEDMRIIGIVLGAGNSKDREKGSKGLLSYAEDNFVKKTIIKEGEYVGEKYLYKDEDLSVKLFTNDSLILVRKDNGSNKFIKDKQIIVNDIEYPVAKGEKVGVIRYTLYDDRVVNIDLVSGNEINNLPLLLLVKIWFKDLF